MLKMRHGLFLFSILLSVETAWSHAKLLSASRTNDPNFNSPPPRSEADDLKPFASSPPPCGGVPPSANPRVYSKGQRIKFEWAETIQHPGVYIIELTTNNGQTFTKLGEMPDTQNGGGVVRNNPNTWHYYQYELALPANVTCDANCFIRFRQQMSVSTVDDGNIDDNDYISCADIKIVDTANPPPNPPPQPPPINNPNDSNQSSQSSETATQDLPSMPGCGTITTGGPKGPMNTIYIIIVMSLFFLPLMLAQQLKPARRRLRK